MQAFRRVKMDWRRKAAAFRLFDTLPGGRRLYYLTQRYVTRSFPRNLADHTRWAVAHARTFRARFDGRLEQAHLFEFGAGWDLFNSLVQWCYGVDRQTIVDIEHWARADQINHAIRHLQAHPPPDSIRVPATQLTVPFEAGLQRAYGIRYLAPADARRTDLADGSVDLICTTSVLEHVPRAALAEIMRESRRVCHARSIVSHVVDYSDHFAHADPQITLYNFLRFPDGEWQRYNPDIHYQNRMRHFEYGELFREAGFDASVAELLQPDDWRRLLDGVPLADRFRGMAPEQLAPRAAHWVLQPA